MSKLKLFFWALLLSFLLGGIVVMPMVLHAAAHIVQAAKALGN